MTFIKVDISHRMAPLQMLYMVTLTYIFKVTTFLELYNINIQNLENGKLVRNAHVRLL